MRVVCQTIAEFIDTVTREIKGGVHPFRGVIYVDRTEIELLKDIKHLISLQASAVIDMGEDGQYLLQAGEDCGVDYYDSENEKVGSSIALHLRKQLEDFCEAEILSLCPGVVDM